MLLTRGSEGTSSVAVVTFEKINISTARDITRGRGNDRKTHESDRGTTRWSFRVLFSRFTTVHVARDHAPRRSRQLLAFKPLFFPCIFSPFPPFAFLERDFASFERASPVQDAKKNF